MPSEAEVAWAAGFFEGEGCIVIYSPTGHRGHPRVALSAVSTDRDVLERWAIVVGWPRVHVGKTKVAEHHKQQYLWRLGTNREVVRILTVLRPWFGARRGARADEALALLAYSRTHCNRGHDKPLDSKGCATCAKPWLAAQEARRRVASS